MLRYVRVGIYWDMLGSGYVAWKDVIGLKHRY
jgi:hypothetical protein